eukprot:CAMPEP_0182445268 /NCGR_PEP_ID=MMETSP1172-20130603/3449_1 /TAXON_ID=708627 /ORGANISM="Timspurckia oligopyrenoides, Strain CCMP3278" /LENGTH=346 /DNA_ID=CAMNT_0024641001 /DNA_START=279 /DNA_END=1319 /DNA_ORIENTATION=-
MALTKYSLGMICVLVSVLSVIVFASSASCAPIIELSEKMDIAGRKVIPSAPDYSLKTVLRHFNATQEEFEAFLSEYTIDCRPSNVYSARAVASFLMTMITQFNPAYLDQEVIPVQTKWLFLRSMQNFHRIRPDSTRLCVDSYTVFSLGRTLRNLVNMGEELNRENTINRLLANTSESLYSVNFETPYKTEQICGECLSNRKTIDESFIESLNCPAKNQNSRTTCATPFQVPLELKNNVATQDCSSFLLAHFNCFNDSGMTNGQGCKSAEELAKKMEQVQIDFKLRVLESEELSKLAQILKSLSGDDYWTQKIGKFHITCGLICDLRSEFIQKLEELTSAFNDRACL